MKKTFLSILGVCTLSACAHNEPLAVAVPAPASAALRSGLFLADFDPAVRPQDDLYLHVNGHWLATFPIPADKTDYGAFRRLDEEAKQKLRGLIEQAAALPNKPIGSDEQKVGDLYTSFMNEAKADARGISPLTPELARIGALKNKKQLAAYFGHMFRTGGGAPLAGFVEQDAKDPERYVIGFSQSGLSLPDRDYYLLDEARFKEFRSKLAAHITRMYQLAGWKDGDAAAKSIMQLELALAQAQWARVDNRDAEKTYNPQTASQLKKLMPGFDWAALRAQADLPSQPFYVIHQPSYFGALNRIVATTKLPAWKEYLRWQLLRRSAPLLSKSLVEENFAFYGKTLSGQQEDRPRWKRAVQMTERAVGETVGRMYVAKYFPPEAKTRMDALVKNLLAAYQQSFQTNDWMDAPTRVKAQEKLATFDPMIGYPSKWRDYSGLSVSPDDLFGNVARATELDYQHEVKKLGAPPDRQEWSMTPQTVDAYYEASLNQMVFPAGILQPPFFDLEADDAVNYGGIGAVIGHEIGHGFDDQGSKYDAKGALNNWWTPETRGRFEAKTAALIKQYDAYEPLPGQHINGALTIGENLADLGGMAIAYKAYHLSLNGKEAPVIDGLTGDQRFFMGWAQGWQQKFREERLLALLKTNPHAPGEYRCNGVVVNMPEFMRAFGVKPGDRLYRAPGQQITVW